MPHAHNVLSLLYRPMRALPRGFWQLWQRLSSSHRISPPLSSTMDWLKWEVEHRSCSRHHLPVHYEMRRDTRQSIIPSRSLLSQSCDGFTAYGPQALDVSYLPYRVKRCQLRLLALIGSASSDHGGAEKWVGAAFDGTPRAGLIVLGTRS